MGAEDAIVVTGLAITPVKGTRLRLVDSVALELGGVRANRRFYLIDERDRMVNSKHIGELNAVLADYSDEDRTLAITFPDGHTVQAPVELGSALTTRFYSRTGEARVVHGPWARVLSEFVGQPVRLVETETGVDRGPRGAASLISRASLAQLAQEAGEPHVDGRRFRMLIEIDGVGANAEDRWVGVRTRIGGAIVRWVGHVGRCLITSRDPETGKIDLPTLDILRDYRSDLDTTEPLPLGIYGEVVQPGQVRVGDPVAPVD